MTKTVWPITVFTNHLNHKFVNKTTFGMPSILNYIYYFLRLLGFPHLPGKVFVITF